MMRFYRRSIAKVVKFHKTKPTIKSVNIRKRYMARTALESTKIKLVNSKKRILYGVLNKLISNFKINTEILNVLTDDADEYRCLPVKV